VSFISTKPPAGFRDFPPELMLLRKKVIRRIEEVFEKYGYDPIDTPALEYWNVLKGKYGEEAEKKLVWRFTDPWSGREYALRYDLTVPLARFIASKGDVPLPFKRYHIGLVWRHEEPQRGRYREFYQCDVDVIGSPYPEADAEIINIILEVMNLFNFEEYTIKVNDRRILKGIFEEYLGIDEPYPVYVIIDKLDKIGLEGVREQLREKVSEEMTSKIEEVISLRGRPFEVLEEVEEKFASNQSVKIGVEHLREIFELINDLSKIFLDLSMVRGLEYYTGPIFETVVSKPRIGSLTGGGRYDELIGMFLGRKIPATGTTIGIERLLDAGIELGLFKLDRKTITQIYIVSLTDKARRESWRLARELRDRGFKVSLDLSRHKQSKQRKYAQKLDIPILIFLGEKELKENTVTVYSRRTGKRVVVSRNELADTLENLLKEL